MRNRSGSIQVETRLPLREVMRTRPTTIDTEATVATAAATMCREEVGSCIVLDRKVPIGIVTEEDINCKVVAKDLKPSTIAVNQIMSTPLITIGADKTIGDAAHMMVHHRVRRLPVVEGQTVVGIVTVRDILSAASEINDILNDLLVINREEPEEMGVCDRCGKMADDLRRIDNQIVCAICREEERLV